MSLTRPPDIEWREEAVPDTAYPPGLEPGTWAPFQYPIRYLIVSCEIGNLNYRIALKFDRYISSNVDVKFQSSRYNSKHQSHSFWDFARFYNKAVLSDIETESIRSGNHFTSNLWLHFKSFEINFGNYSESHDPTDHNFAHAIKGQLSIHVQTYYLIWSLFFMSE